ncbi:hypothetical protein AALB64_08550 [Lachnospiraceae bacterium 45-P1]
MNFQTHSSHYPKNNMDEVFLRRMRYIVEFKLLDVETRREI